jgi:cysteine desulfurase/selenocysteine lyase
LDSSATSLKPQCVIDDVTSYYEKYGTNPHNSDSKLAYDLILKLKSCRQNIASFFNAKNNEIIFTSGATDGLNLICQNLINWLKPNDEVLLSYGEHSSNLLP